MIRQVGQIDPFSLTVPDGPNVILIKPKVESVCIERTLSLSETGHAEQPCGCQFQIETPDMRLADLKRVEQFHVTCFSTGFERRTISRPTVPLSPVTESR